MKLKDFCIKEGKEYLLKEWDDKKNLPFTPETISHTTSLPVWWKCEKAIHGRRNSEADQLHLQSALNAVMLN